jgi:hypothetical protein
MCILLWRLVNQFFVEYQLIVYSSIAMAVILLIIFNQDKHLVKIQLLSSFDK